VKRKTLLLITCCILVALFGLVLYLFMPFSPKRKPLLITEESAPDGIEMCLTQTYNGFLDPYDISFYYRKSRAERWRWCYINHEDFYWWSGSIVVDPNTNIAKIKRGAKEIAVFDWDAETLTFINRERRVVTAPHAEITGTPLDPGRRLPVVRVSDVEEAHPGKNP